MAIARIVSLKALVHGVSAWSPHSQHLLRSLTPTSAVRAYSSATSPPSKAVVYDQHGSPDIVTRVTELPPVEIKENDVCVRMLAAPINPSDINRIEGFWLQRWMNSDKAEECRSMIDYLLGLCRDGKLKYELEVAPFDDFHSALEKAMGKRGSQPKQVLNF